MLFDHFICADKKGGAVRIIFHYLFYVGAVLLSVSVVMGAENDKYDVTVMSVMTIGALLMIAGILGGRKSD